MPEPKKKKVARSAAAAEDRANYMELAFVTNRELGETIVMLNARKNGFASGSETLFIEGRIDNLHSERFAVQADLNAFLAESLSILPPTEADMKAVKDLVHQLDMMTAQSTEAAIMVKGATDLLDIWRRTR